MKGGRGFGYGWGNIIRPRTRSKSKSIFEDSDMRSAKRRKEETNRLADQMFARDIGYSKCMGMSKEEFKENYRPLGGMGDRANKMIDLLWNSPIGAIKRKKNRKKKKKKNTKNKKHKMSISKIKKTKVSKKKSKKNKTRRKSISKYI